jgi:hypothetical protein
MASPPASLESQRSQRDFSFNFLLSPAKEQRDVNKGRKLKTGVLRAYILCALCGSAVKKHSLKTRKGEINDEEKCC